MKYFLAFILALASMLAQADQIEDKARKLFQVQGIVSSYQSLIDQGRAQARLETKQMLDQILGQLNPSKEFQDRFAQAADKYLKTLLTDRTAQEIVDVLIKYYAPNFSAQELDKLIEFYGSALGKKEAAVSKSASEKLMNHYKSENERIRISATNVFIKDVQLIAQQCNCAKPSKASEKK
ncbi:MAG: DUF2059 domain-containing protein [Burkholderiales bacterium]